MLHSCCLPVLVCHLLNNIGNISLASCISDFQVTISQYPGNDPKENSDWTWLPISPSWHGRVTAMKGAPGTIKL